MEEKEEVRESKGIYQMMKESANIVKWPSNPPLTTTDIHEFFEGAWKADIERRERMDKEYTDIGKITDKEIEDVITQYGGIDSAPNGLFAKVKVAGSYMDMPVKGLIALKEAAKRMYNAQKKDTTEDTWELPKEESTKKE